MINNINKNHGGQSKYQATMGLLSELHDLCKNMTFYLATDPSDPQTIRFMFRIAKNGRERFHTILDQLRKNGISFGIAARDTERDDLVQDWVSRLSQDVESNAHSASWRREFFKHLRQSTQDCRAQLEFSPETDQINLVVILNPGLLEKFVYAVDALANLGVKGCVKLVEQSV